MEKTLTTPIKNEDIEQLKAGDIVYLDGYLITCRDMPHRRLIDQGRKLPVDLNGLAIFHAGPIVAKDGDGWKWSPSVRLPACGWRSMKRVYRADRCQTDYR